MSRLVKKTNKPVKFISTNNDKRSCNNCVNLIHWPVYNGKANLYCDLEEIYIPEWGATKFRCEKMERVDLI